MTMQKVAIGAGGLVLGGLMGYGIPALIKGREPGWAREIREKTLLTGYPTPDTPASRWEFVGEQGGAVAYVPHWTTAEGEEFMLGFVYIPNPEVWTEPPYIYGASWIRVFYDGVEQPHVEGRPSLHFFWPK